MNIPYRDPMGNTSWIVLRGSLGCVDNFWKLSHHMARWCVKTAWVVEWCCWCFFPISSSLFLLVTVLLWMVVVLDGCCCCCCLFLFLFLFLFLLLVLVPPSFHPHPFPSCCVRAYWTTAMDVSQRISLTLVSSWMADPFKSSRRSNRGRDQCWDRSSWGYGVLVGGFKYFFFHPYLGKWSNLTNIF